MRKKIVRFLNRIKDGRAGGQADVRRTAGTERCVVCGRLTDVPKGMPVSERKTYLPGGGQLCEDCCYEIYHTTDLRAVPEPQGQCRSRKGSAGRRSNKRDVLNHRGMCQRRV